MNPHHATVAEIGRGLRAREYSSVEITRHFLDRIGRANESLNAFLTVTGARALADALERMIDMGAEKRAEMGLAGQARARALYTKAALQEATLAVYRRVLAESGHRGKRKLGSETKHDAGEKA